MKKKREEGYALVFVLVVIVVLSIISLSLMSISLRNLQAQTASIERMQDTYAALGAVEVLVAKLKSTEQLSNAEVYAETMITLLQEDYDIELKKTDVALFNTGDGDDGRKVILPIVSKSGSVQIECELEWTVKLGNLNDSTYEVISSEVMYKTYKISSVTATANSSKTEGVQTDENQTK